MYTAAYGLGAVSPVPTVNPVDGNPGNRARPSTVAPAVPFTRPRTTTRRRPSGMTRPRGSGRPGPVPASSRSLRAAPRGTLKHIGGKLMGAGENDLPIPLAGRSGLTRREPGWGVSLQRQPDNRLVSALGGVFVGGGGCQVQGLEIRSQKNVKNPYCR